MIGGVYKEAYPTDERMVASRRGHGGIGRRAGPGPASLCWVPAPLAAACRGHASFPGQSERQKAGSDQQFARAQVVPSQTA